MMKGDDYEFHCSSDSSSSDGNFGENMPRKRVNLQTREKSQGEAKRPRKANVCIYCDKKFVKISQHMRKMHDNEPKMVEIMNGNLTQQERRKEFNKLVGKANYRHNCEAKANHREADIILKYGRIEASCGVQGFIPCKHCGHVYHISSANRHKCVEEFRKNLKEGEKCRLVAESKLKWHSLSRTTPAVRKLFMSLVHDDIAEIVMSDATIIKFAEDRIEGVELLPHEKAAEVLHNEKIAQLRAKLRKAANFLKHFRNVSSQCNMTLKDAFSPENNRYLQRVGVELSKQYTSPYSLSNLKTLLGHFFTTLLNQAIRSKEISKWTQYRENFFYRWNNAIQPRVRIAKRNMGEISTFDVPTGAMMSRFNNYINDNLNSLLNKEITTYDEYLELARFAFTRITTFNKRRGQEVARMTLNQYHRRIRGKSEVGVSHLKMSKLEREIAEFIDVVTLKGKSSKNEIVYAILLRNCVAAIDILLDARKKFEGLNNNDYVFAQLGSKHFHIPGSRIIRDIAIRAKVKPLEAFTAGKLRKYIATDMVWMNSDPQVKTLLASQLGHILSMHDNVYNENMRSTFTKLHKIPAVLGRYEAGLPLNKTVEDMTDDDTLHYIRDSVGIDTESKVQWKKSSGKKGMEKDSDRIEESDGASDSMDDDNAITERLTPDCEKDCDEIQESDESADGMDYKVKTRSVSAASPCTSRVLVNVESSDNSDDDYDISTSKASQNFEKYTMNPKETTSKLKKYSAGASLSDDNSDFNEDYGVTIGKALQELQESKNNGIVGKPNENSDDENGAHHHFIKDPASPVFPTLIKHKKRFKKTLIKSKTRSSAIHRNRSDTCSSYSSRVNLNDAKPVPSTLRTRMQVFKTSKNPRFQDASNHNASDDCSSNSCVKPVTSALKKRVPVVKKTSNKSKCRDSSNHISRKDCSFDDDAKLVRLASEKHTPMVDKTSNKPKFQYWSDEMKKILKQEFKAELRSSKIPVKKTKLLSCQRRIFNQCSRNVSIGSIKGTIHHERAKLKRW